MIMAADIMITVVMDMVIGEVHTKEVMAGTIIMITLIRTRIKTLVKIFEAMAMDALRVVTMGVPMAVVPTNIT